MVPGRDWDPKGRNDCGLREKRKNVGFTARSYLQMLTAVLEPHSTVLCVHSLLEHMETQIKKCKQLSVLKRDIGSRKSPWILRHP